MRLYLDTCVLPERGRLKSGFMSVVLALSRAGVVEIRLPELVLEEYASLRRRKAEEAVAEYNKGYRKLTSHFPDLLPSIYLPAVNEAVEPLVAELRSEAVILPTRPEDAMLALKREAGRVPPARNGHGARDTAIWLTVARDHSSSAEQHGVFVTTNTLDFAGEDGTPHRVLIDDLGHTADRFQFSFKPFELLSRIAPSVSPMPVITPTELNHDPDYISDMLTTIFQTGMFSEYEAGLDTGGDFPIWMHAEELAVVDAVEVISALQISPDRQLFKVRSSVQVPTVLEEKLVQTPVSLIAWIDKGPEIYGMIAVEQWSRT